MNERDHDTVVPYHFVPAVEGSERRGDLCYREVRDGRHEGLLHHRFVRGRLSGRVVCRLTTETPIGIGGERQRCKGEPDRVERFLMNGEPALPASSLRGMISAIAEAASNSALRVLDDRVYSFRKSASRALRNLGIVEVQDGAPGMETYSLRRLSKLVRVGPKDSLDKPLETWRPDRPRDYGLDLAKAKKGAAPMPWEDVEKLPPADRNRYTRGIARVLRAPGRNLPESRKWELFIPYEEDKRPHEEDKRPSAISIRPEAVDRFHELAKERWEASKDRRDHPDLPYEPAGTSRNPDPEDGSFRLKSGDLVFYDTNREGEAVEIALSQIWRDRVPHRARSFFEKIDRDLAPFHAGRTQGRLTLAEQLFGFVSDDDDPADPAAVPALASRLRFSFGRLEPGQADPFLESCTLRILDSPKPPSPSLYFSDFSDPESYIAKHELDPERHRPHGRKLYVHQKWDPESDPETWPWRTRDETERPDMKSSVEPLRHDLSFVFHVDFDNLSEEDLGLLLYALRPTEGFRHKLGMGKPIGLGSVRIDVLGLLEVDREQRYRRQGLFAPRYARASFAGDRDLEALGERYRHENEAAMQADGDERIVKLRKSSRDAMDTRIRTALERLGEEKFEPSEVSVPLILDGDRETETFEWFVTNDRTAQPNRQVLAPLVEGDWPRFRRHPKWDPQKSGRGQRGRGRRQAGRGRRSPRGGR